MKFSLKDWRWTPGLACAASAALATSLLAKPGLPAQGYAVLAADAQLPPGSQAQSPEVDPATKKLMAAHGLFQRGLFKLAADGYKEFLTQNPQHPEATNARYALAVCAYRLNDYPAAIESLQPVLKDPKFEQKDEALAVLGYCQLAGKQYDAAQATFGDLLAKYPKSKHAESAGVYQVQALYLGGKHAEAVKAAAAFSGQYPNSAERPTTLYFQSLSLRALGRNEEAAATLEALTKDHPDSKYKLDAILLLGQTLEAQGKGDAAIEQYRRMLAAAPETRKADAHYSLGVALYKSAKYDEAAKELGVVAADFPSSPYAKPAKLQQGLAQLATGKTADARRTLSAVVQEDPARAPDAQYGLAQCDIADKKFEPARAALDSLSQQQPAPANLPQILLDRAVCGMELAKYEDAAGEFAALATKFPKSPLLPEAIYRQAFCLHKLAKYEQSHAACAQVASLPPSEMTTPAAELDAENLFLLGKYPDAQKAFASLAAGAKTDIAKLRYQFRQGQCEYFAGNYDKAVALLQPVADDPQVDKSADLQQAVFLLGDAQLQQKKHAQAAEALKKYIAMAKGEKREAQCKLALAQLGAGDADAAQATLAPLTQGPSDDPWVQRALIEYGQLCYKNKKPDAAATALSKLAAANAPAELAAPAAYLLGWIDFDAKRYPDAAARWKTVVEKYPNHPLATDASFQAGVALKEAGKPDEAVAALQSFAAAHADSPNAPKARQLAAAILGGQGKNEQAAKMLADLAADPKASDTVLYDLAWAQRGTRDSAAATESYRRLLKAHSDSKLAPAARTELADLLYADKKYSDAAELLETVVADKSADAKVQTAAMYQLGWCYAKLNKPDKAAAIFSEFAATHPDDADLTPSALLQAGIASCDEGKFDRAEKSLAQLVKNFPTYKDAPVAFLRLGEAQSEQQEFDAALATYRQFLQKFPKSEFAYRAEYGCGWALENQKQYDAARAAYQRVIATSNTETAARAQFQIGETCLAEGKLEQSIKEFLAVEDVYKYPKWSARALLESGRAFEQLKQPAEARQQYAQLVAKYKDAPEAQLAQERLKAL
ncbi:MAG TPA: tetratricopeptide repeat protein [Tepidisphaeraceae bacterium]|nr:tetratricopeptide repeat protein [Tepidisphaeraceae bacterium]